MEGHIRQTCTLAMVWVILLKKLSVPPAILNAHPAPLGTFPPKWTCIIYMEAFLGTATPMDEAKWMMVYCDSPDSHHMSELDI